MWKSNLTSHIQTLEFRACIIEPTKKPLASQASHQLINGMRRKSCAVSVPRLNLSDIGARSAGESQELPIPDNLPPNHDSLNSKAASSSVSASKGGSRKNKSSFQNQEQQTEREKLNVNSVCLNQNRCQILLLALPPLN